MSCSSAFKWFLTVVLLLSIAWKITIRYDHQSDPNDRLVDFFARKHFDVAVTEQSGIQIIQANTASCSLRIARLASNGSDQDLVRDLAGGSDHLFVIFRGQVYAQQPIFWTVFNDIWSRHLRELELLST